MHMTNANITGIAPFFIVRDVPAALSFYRDRLGFDITFQGPAPDDIFFGIVQRGAAMIMLKHVGVEPVPNYTRDVGKGWARWDAYLHVPGAMMYFTIRSPRANIPPRRAEIKERDWSSVVAVIENSESQS
jgi:hypothetical protein